MKTKDLLMKLTVNNLNINGMNSLFGKELKIIEPFIKELDEFKNIKQIEIATNFDMFVPSKNINEKHIELITSELHNCKFNDNVLIYGLFMCDNIVYIRCANYSSNNKSAVVMAMEDKCNNQRKLLRAYHTYLLTHTDKEECNHTIEEFLMSYNGC